MTALEGWQATGRDRRLDDTGVMPTPRRRARDRHDGRRGEGDGAARARDERMARALGWLSIGLGLAEVVAPGRLARMIGVNDRDENRTLLRTLGMRELVSGIGILAQPSSAGWVGSRVGGDMMDLALLGRAFTSDDSRRNRVAAATAAVVGITALDALSTVRLRRAADESAGMTPGAGRQVVHSVTINRSPDEVYAFWRDLQNLPRFMRNLESVQMLEGGRSHWVARAPAGRTVEWDAEIVEDRPGALIAWRSLPGADVDNAGTVRFSPAPGGRGTEVRVEMRYDAPGGAAGVAAAKLFHAAPGQEIEADLRRFKQVVETGEVTRSDASIHRGKHPAQPPEGTDWKEHE